MCVCVGGGGGGGGGQNALSPCPHLKKDSSHSDVQSEYSSVNDAWHSPISLSSACME